MMPKSFAFFSTLCAFIISVGAAWAVTPQPTAGTGPLAYALGQQDEPVIATRLVASHSSVQPGQSIGLAWEFKLAPHWHVYWQNPGDSGLPASLKPEVANAPKLTLNYPAPKVIPVPPITNYGYEDATTLHTTSTVPASLGTGAQNLTFSGKFLYCKDVCMPGSVTLSLPLTVASTPVANADYRAETPIPALPQGASVVLNSQSFSLSLPAGIDGATARFIPHEEGLIDDSAPQTWNGRTLTIQRDSQNDATPTRFSGILLVGSQAYTLSLPVPVGGIHTEATPPQTQGVAAAPQAPGLATALFLALAAGLILNLMPCVLPVLSLKLLGLIQTHGGTQRRKHALAYAAGVVASFWGFALLIALLRLGGTELGWGFHLQNPLFVAGLALLMLAVALNFFGLFELGSGLSRLGGKPGSGQESLAGSLGTGVLAVVVATPCTVPFMGGAMAYALTQPLLPSVAVFTALGLGMALPFLLAIPFPAIFGWLPKPGKWMPAFRHALGWPMLITALWLLSVFATQTNAGAVINLLGLALLLGFGLWLKGAHPSGYSNLVLVVIAVAGLVFMQQQLAPRQTPAHVVWQTWSPEAVEAARKTNQPVFVDFTADWCVTCKVTEMAVLNTTATQAMLAKNNVALFRADWTNADPAITAELAAHGRRGVPLYLVYRPGDTSPTILPQLLTYSILEKALQ
jgi:thiol:disulfide interchange protein DsbD